jgi:hypothetical protein
LYEGQECQLKGDVEFFASYSRNLVAKIRVVQNSAYFCVIRVFRVSSISPVFDGLSGEGLQEAGSSASGRMSRILFNSSDSLSEMN